MDECHYTLTSVLVHKDVFIIHSTYQVTKLRLLVLFGLKISMHILAVTDLLHSYYTLVLGLTLKLNSKAFTVPTKARTGRPVSRSASTTSHF